MEGIFLSSSIFNGGVTTQDKLLDTARILRQRLGFEGYLHLKIMPGAERAQVEEALCLADRLSVNLEAPHPEALTFLAPQKDFKAELLNPLQWIQEIRRKESPEKAWKGRWPTSTTQFVVGAAGESDLDILSTTVYLLDTCQISRAYYSSFNPFPDTPLENHSPSPPRREVRLYQAFFLLRDYGFNMEDLDYKKDGFLSLDKDPKTAWAERHLRDRPLEINKAPREDLLRVPGLGPARVESIISLRRKNKLNSFTQLKRLRLIEERTAPYILVNGHSPARQLSLF